MLITDEYRKLNQQLHREQPGFGSHSLNHYPLVMKLAKKHECKTILDYGCGKGGMAKAIKKDDPGLDVHEYDPCMKGKDKAKPADLVVSFDVMEHIEPGCLDDVLEHIRSLTGKVFYCVIATRPSKKVLADGRNSHLIVQPAEWWRERLGRYFEILSAGIRDDKLQCVFECKPRT